MWSHRGREGGTVLCHLSIFGPSSQSWRNSIGGSDITLNRLRKGNERIRGRSETLVSAAAVCAVSRLPTFSTTSISSSFVRASVVSSPVLHPLLLLLSHRCSVTIFLLSVCVCLLLSPPLSVLVPFLFSVFLLVLFPPFSVFFFIRSFFLAFLPAFLLVAIPIPAFPHLPLPLFTASSSTTSSS